MPDVRDILNDDDFLVDIIDTPKEGFEQNKKRKCLKSVIDKGKVHLLGHKWTHERVDKASDEIINKTYAEYKQGEITAKVLGKLVSKRISQFVKIRDDCIQILFSSKELILLKISDPHVTQN